MKKATLALSICTALALSAHAAEPQGSANADTNARFGSQGSASVGVSASAQGSGSSNAGDFRQDADAARNSATGQARMQADQARGTAASSADQARSTAREARNETQSRVRAFGEGISAQRNEAAGRVGNLPRPGVGGGPSQGAEIGIGTSISGGARTGGVQAPRPGGLL